MNFRRSVVSVVEALVSELRARILSGDLAPGTPLGEVDIASSYEVSRPTARSAIEALVSARLLARGAHKTARVVSLLPEDVDDIYRTRALIESETVRRLAERGHVPQEAVLANAEISRLKDGSPRAVVKPDVLFHRSLVDALRSERTSTVYAVLADELELCMSQVQSAHLLDTEQISREHGAILDAIAALDGEAAARLLTEHLDNARTRLRERLVSQV